MEYKHIFSFDIKWNIKTISLLAFLAVFPNLLGMINLPTQYGFKIHLFQYLIFLAAAIYGPVGGLVSGGFGSLFSAMSMNNPYILVGNMILGFATGLFIRKGFQMILAALAAYLVQLPWLYYTDVYLVKMPAMVVQNIIIGLLVSNVLWAVLAYYSCKPIKELVCS